MNRDAVKKVFSGMDQKGVIQFVERYRYAIGLSDNGVFGDTAKNWMSLWK